MISHELSNMINRKINVRACQSEIMMGTKSTNQLRKLYGVSEQGVTLIGKLGTASNACGARIAINDVSPLENIN